MSWKDNLQPASFRGAAFEVEDAETSSGRRGHLHEYPLQDVPYFEDLGRKGREHSLVGYVIGPDYQIAKEALIKALETKGPGELVHPWEGRKTLSVTGFRYRESHREGGMCRFDITYVETGEVTYPTTSIATSQQSVLAAESLEQRAIEAFVENFSVEGLPAFASEDAVNSMNAILDSLEGGLGSVGGVLSSPVGSTQNAMGDLVNDPLNLANRVFGLFAKGDAVLVAADRLVLGYSDLDSLNYARVFTTLRATSLFRSPSRPSNLTPTRAKVLDNRDAMNALTRQALLVQASGMTAVMPLPVYDDAVRLRTETLRAIDDESMVAGDDAYLALQDLRAKVHNDMTARTQNAARLREIRPAQVTPGLALAYELYESVDREGEIIARNRVRHPGFVPAVPLKVLNA